MTTTPEASDPIGTMELRRTVDAIIVSAATAHVARWSPSGVSAVQVDVRVVVTAVDAHGREHHLSLSPETATALMSSLTVSHLEALNEIETLS